MDAAQWFPTAVQGSATARDAVQKEALRRAGIGYVEIVSGDTLVDVRAIVLNGSVSV